MKNAIAIGLGMTSFVLSACTTRVDSKGPPGGMPDPVITMHAIGGMAAGLLRPGLVLELNGGGDLRVDQDGSFVFPSSLASGAPYDITVAKQPPGEMCSIGNGTGTMGAGDLANVAVMCSPKSYAVGGTVSGLQGTLVLQDNGADDLSISADGNFTFATPVASGASYTISVLTQPTGPNQTCIVANGKDTVIDSNTDAVSITCTTNTYIVNVQVSGVQGGGLVLQDNGGDDLAVGMDGTYAFATKIPDGATYAVSIATQPSNPDQTCTVDPGGTINGADVTLKVTCP